tara:strand:- start:830 stop:1426 length:597 start_codon:yes stop_codon:yes gene_type:complete
MLYYISLFLFSIIFAQADADTNIQQPNPDHISLTIHEDLINVFFQNMGEIRGEGTSSVMDYSWFLLEPRVEIEENQAHFYAKVRAKTKNFRITRDVVGTMSVTFDQEQNILDVMVDKADVILDVDIFGKNVVLGKIDIAKHFSKSLKLNGPQSIEDQVEFKLPDGSIRIMDVEVVSYNLKLLKNEIVVSTSLGFKVNQ